MNAEDIKAHMSTYELSRIMSESQFKKIILRLNDKAQFHFKLKAEDEWRIYGDGYAIFQYENTEVVCADQPFYDSFQDIFSFLQHLPLTSPMEPQKINRVGQLEYEGIQREQFDYQEYYFLSSSEINCFLYKIAENLYNIEIVAGSPYNDTPFKLLYHSELSQDILDEWYEITFREFNRVIPLIFS